MSITKLWQLLHNKTKNVYTFEYHSTKSVLPQVGIVAFQEPDDWHVASDVPSRVYPTEHVNVDTEVVPVVTIFTNNPSVASITSQGSEN